MDYNTLVTFVVATAALAISPGPDNIFVLTQSIANGVKYGLATTAGLMSGCLVHTTFVAFGMSVVLKENETLFYIIKVFGALYLVFLAYKTYQSSSTLVLSKSSENTKSVKEMYWQGFIMNVLNPKVAIFFLAFFPGFLFSKEINTVFQFYVLGILFMLVSFGVFGMIALLGGQIISYFKEGTRVGTILKWFQIAVFLGIAAYLFFFNK